MLIDRMARNYYLILLRLARKILLVLLSTYHLMPEKESKRGSERKYLRLLVGTNSGPLAIGQTVFAPWLTSSGID